MELYDLKRFALKPWGGYKVILTPFCKTEIGKVGVGMEVSHSRKSELVASPNSSTNFSKEGIHEAAKWQFCNKTQVPFNYAPFTNCSALIPWP